MNQKESEKMSYDDQNIFAKIIHGEIPCDKVYENYNVLAFKDISPQKETHILVIPKGPYVSLTEFSANATAEEVMAFHKAVSEIVNEQGLTTNGYRAIANSGEDGGQEVPHFHLHLLGGEPVGPMVG